MDDLEQIHICAFGITISAVIIRLAIHDIRGDDFPGLWLIGTLFWLFPGALLFACAVDPEHAGHVIVNIIGIVGHMCVLGLGAVILMMRLRRVCRRLRFDPPDSDTPTTMVFDGYRTIRRVDSDMSAALRIRRAAYQRFPVLFKDAPRAQ